MSGSDWWPGSDDPDPTKAWPQPAFTTQRRVVPGESGGDYVRGSTEEGLHKSALRFPTSSTFETEELTGSGIFYARPLDYEQIEVTWGTVLDLTKWSEFVIIRSAFGFPMTVNDGQVVMRATKDSLFPIGYTLDSETQKPIVEARRFRDPRSVPGMSAQSALPNGRWYYYSLFFRSGLKWHRYMVTSTLLPRDRLHAEYLWNSLPPYYQYVDDQQRGGTGDGDLRKFFSLIGFDLDLTREYVESLLDLYHTDFCPVPLLRRLGGNYGVPYESGLGDIRYRGLISKVGFLYQSRGTVAGLEEMVVSVTKCMCEVTSSANIMLMPDDSDFFEGTGNWAGVHPDTSLATITGPAISPAPLTPDKVRLESGTQVVRPPENSGRGVMRMWTSKADATAGVLITCGTGIAQDYDLGASLVSRSDDVFQGIREIYPRYAGIPVQPLGVYSFSIKIKLDLQPAQRRLFILWFDKDGDSQDIIDDSPSGEAPINNTNWATHTVQGTAPAGAAYAVPAVYLHTRQAGSDATYSPYVYFCAAQFSFVGSAATVAAQSPDIYLTLGTPEKIGPPTDDPPFEGYLIGDPTP